MPDGILDLGLVVGPPGNITSSTITVNPGHLEQPTATVVMGGEPGDQSIAFTFDGLQGNDATLPIATTDIVGKVKPDGTTIKITSDGTISAELGDYARASQLPKLATSDIAGLVKPDGTSIKVTEDGTISIETTPVATSDRAGIVKPDGKSIKVTGDGTISVDTVAVATTEVAGTVKPDGDTISVDTDGKIKVAKVLADTIRGEIPLANLPQGALERIVTVDDESARFSLTAKNVQLGDVVKQSDTGVMYVVSDESNLTNSNGYTEFTAGTATQANHATSSDTATKLANPVQINGVDFDGSQSITVKDDTKLPLTGGNITGALTASGNITGNYLVSAWLQTKSTTNLNKAPERYPVLDPSGWLYFRTATETKADLDIATKTEFPDLLKSNIEVIREALGLATTEHMGLIPKLPS